MDLEDTSTPTTANRNEDLERLLIDSYDSTGEGTLPFPEFPDSAGEDDGSADTTLAGEEAITAWLRDQIRHYQARLQAIQSSDDIKKNEKALRRDLFDESDHIQQETLLLHRIRQCTVAASATKYFELADDTADDARTELLREGLISRDRQVKTALERSRRLDQLRNKVQETQASLYKVQQDNRTLWSEAVGNMRRRRQEMATIGSAAPNVPTTAGDCRTRDKNILLKGALVDLLAGTGLDWDSDDRLRQIMKRVTKD